MDRHLHHHHHPSVLYLKTAPFYLHTGQNYDYNLNGVFFKDLKLADPDIYMEAVGDDLGATMGNIIDKSLWDSMITTACR